MKQQIENKITYLMQIPPPSHGAAVINKKIFDSTIINAGLQKSLIPINFVNDLKQIGKISPTKFTKLISLSIKLITTFIKFKPTYIYFTCNCTGVAFFRDWCLIFLIKIFKKKLILHFHGKGIAEKSKSIFYRVLYQLAFNNTSLIFISKQVMQNECDNLSLKNTNLYYVENGIDSINMLPTHKNNTVVNLLFLSTLMPSKGLYILIDSIAKIKTKTHFFHLNIVGGTMDNNEIKKICSRIDKLQLNQYITLRGAAYGEKKYPYFSEADIFIHPTLNDNFPLVLLEAMQFSLPIISTIEGGIPDIIVDNITGFLVAKNNVADLTEKLILLIENPALREKLGKAGQQRFQQKFKTEHFEKNLRQVLQTIIATNKGLETSTRNKENDQALPL